MTPIIVMGMHRSGTSLVARILHESGISMGKDLLVPDKLNSAGYFEDEDFLWVNKGILENCGGSWYEPPSRDCIQKQSEKFRKNFKAIVRRKREAAKNRSWGWKDPRNILTCWFFHSWVVNPKYVIVRRHKKDVLRSLKVARPNLDVDWDTLYARYELDLNLFLRRKTPPAMEVAYEEIVDRNKFRPTVRSLLIFAGEDPLKSSKLASIVQFREF